jgi:type VI secretion system protein ImpL
VWWILSGLLVLIVWTLKLILQAALSIWVPIIVTIVIAIFMIVLFIYQRVSVGRAASALEKAIAAQGAQQALNARPERRAEIQELQKQVQTGINALKTSKLGKGKKGGAAALYSLPWYVIIGPPGAGKTTALKHSGLVFPHQDAGGGGGVRGVGGTRNCDWWFTNEAILLDTAGRYTTETEDRDEWIAFLQMLKRYRTRRPINGVLVAISVADLIDANEQQLEATGKKLRARIDEVMTQLQMVVPVYVLFTKCDLIAGFNEFFGSLRKTERGQAWGATLKLDMPKNEPGKIFDAEFDMLCQQVHARALKCLATERSREAREKIFQFPLEFSGIKRNLSELIASAFQVNSFQGTPIFRGFYFTSGTQEGRPLDRVLGRMGQAMGIRPPEQAAQQVVESKSYFLHDVFMKVAFPDGDIAARSASEVRRQKIMRFAVSGAAALLAVTLAIPGVISFARNRTFLKDTEDKIKAASTIDWGGNRPVSEKLVLLDPMRARLQDDLDDYHDHGPPFGMGWLMYMGDDVRPTVGRAYIDSMQRGFVIPCKQRLEDKMKRFHGDPYITERTDLKAYLMLSDVEHLDVDWATTRFTRLWADLLKLSSDLNEYDLKKRLRPHVEYYFTLLKTKRALPLPPDPALIASARKTLMGVPVQKRYYELFVTELVDETYGDNETKAYPPLTLGEVFGGRPDVLDKMTSAQFQKTKAWKQVAGPYTEKGHYAVVRNVNAAKDLLEAEQWVVPLTAEESVDHIPTNIKRLADDYDQAYLNEWTDWLTDIVVRSPATVKEAIDLYGVLAKAEFPYSRLLRLLEDHTQWKKSPGELEKELQRETNVRLNQELTARTGGLRFNANLDMKKIGDRVSAVPGTFRRTVEFGIPGPGVASTEVPLSKYLATLETLRGDFKRKEDSTPNVDPRLVSQQLDDAARESSALLQPYDDKAKALLSPLLLNPLKIVSVRMPTPTYGGFKPGGKLPFPKK